APSGANTCTKYPGNNQEIQRRRKRPPTRACSRKHLVASYFRSPPAYTSIGSHPAMRAAWASLVSRVCGRREIKRTQLLRRSGGMLSRIFAAAGNVKLSHRANRRLADAGIRKQPATKISTEPSTTFNRVRHRFGREKEMPSYI